MTQTTTTAVHTSMAQSIGHLMDSLEDGIALEITKNTCTISVANSRFVFDNCDKTLSVALDCIEFLNNYQEVR